MKENIKGWHAVDIVWIEEGQRVSHKSMELLLPTMRKDDSEIWVSFNPDQRSDAVWQRFIASGIGEEDRAYIRRVNWQDNPWFPEASLHEMNLDKRLFPERYAHTWQGEPDDEGLTRKLLTYRDLEKCVEAYEKYYMSIGSGRVDMGLDVADDGAAKNAMVWRRGPVILGVETWQGIDLGDTARRAAMKANQIGVRKLFVDSGGVGAGVRRLSTEYA